MTTTSIGPWANIGGHRIHLIKVSTYRLVSPVMLEVVVDGETIHISGTDEAIDGYIQTLDQHFGITS